MDHNGHVLPTLIQFHVRRTSTVKLLSIGTLVDVWHQTLTSLQLLEKAPQLVLNQLIVLACPPGHLPNILKQLDAIQNACDKLLEKTFLGSSIVFC